MKIHFSFRGKIKNKVYYFQSKICKPLKKRILIISYKLVVKIPILYSI